MIKFKPFKAIRPAKNKAVNVTTCNAEDYSEEELLSEIASNPESFLNILKDNLIDNDLDRNERYKKVRSNFEFFMQNNILLEDRKSYYIYQQEKENGDSFIGVIGIISMDDFKEQLIKPHEETILAREKTFAEFLKTTHIQTDPILLSFPENQSIELLFSMVTRHTPTLEFKGVDGNDHKLWQVKDRLVMKQLKTAIEKLPALYVADGHHRLGSSSLYTQYRRDNDDEYFGGEMYNFAMAILVPENHLTIYDFNRLVKDLNGLSEEEFLEKVNESFEVLEKDKPYYPNHKHHISMYLNGKFYNLYVKQEHRGVPKGLGELDTYLWEQQLMKPILDIDNSRTNDRVQFVKGTGDIRGIEKLKQMVDSGEYAVGFGFYPISTHDMRLIADEKQVMPPKSTYIEPKFLTALTIMDLDSL